MSEKVMIRFELGSEEEGALLETGGIRFLWISETPEGKIEFFGNDPESRPVELLRQLFPFASAISLEPFPSIDWDAQWEMHGHHFDDGLIRLPIAEKKLLLKPGPGFGDLSHPTTRLMLAMMRDAVKEKNVLDVGSGSGILTFAACLYGAKRACGIEIDPDAVRHSRENHELNGLEARFFLPDELPADYAPDILLINMISSEQEEALKNLPRTLREAVVSGIPLEERGRYLELARHRRGWKLVDEAQEQGWCAFRFVFLDEDQNPR